MTHTPAPWQRGSLCSLHGAYPALGCVGCPPASGQAPKPGSSDWCVLDSLSMLRRVSNHPCKPQPADGPCDPQAGHVCPGHRPFTRIATRRLRGNAFT